MNQIRSFFHSRQFISRIILFLFFLQEEINYSQVQMLENDAFLRQALTDKINDREIYTKGINASYNYEGYYNYSVIDLAEEK